MWKITYYYHWSHGKNYSLAKIAGSLVCSKSESAIGWCLGVESQGHGHAGCPSASFVQCLCVKGLRGALGTQMPLVAQAKHKTSAS